MSDVSAQLAPLSAMCVCLLLCAYLSEYNCDPPQMQFSQLQAYRSVNTHTNLDCVSAFCTVSHHSEIPASWCRIEYLVCVSGMGAVGLKVVDVDVEHGMQVIADCRGKCNALKGCVAVNWHKGDLHCHVLTGSVTPDRFMASLQKQETTIACMLVKVK